MKLFIYTGLTILLSIGVYSNHYSGMLTQNRMTKEAVAEETLSDFEKAVEIIKKYEGIHQPKHWPLIGYGHLVLPGEKFSRTKTMSQEQAEELLRKDLLKNCAVFRSFGADSLLLGVLAYNIGSGATMKSSVVKKLKAGDRNIYDNYIAHSKYKGKTNNQLKRRRIEEYETLFIKDIENKDHQDSEFAQSEEMVEKYN